MRKEGVSDGSVKPGGTAGLNILSQQLIAGTGFLFGGGDEHDCVCKAMARLRAEYLLLCTRIDRNAIAIYMNMKGVYD